MKTKKPAKTIISEINKATSLHDLDVEKAGVIYDEDFITSINDLGGSDVSVGCTINGFEVGARLEQQPGCCANLILFDFYGMDKNILTVQAAFRVMFLTAIKIAASELRTNLCFTHLDSGPWAKAALKLGFKISRTYQSRSTGNVLSDFYYEL